MVSKRAASDNRDDFVQNVSKQFFASGYKRPEVDGWTDAVFTLFE